MVESGSCSSQAFDLGTYLLERGNVPRNQSNPPAGTGEPMRDRASDTRGSAGNHDNPWSDRI